MGVVHEQLLRPEGRLVTLSGPAGTGKTRATANVIGGNPTGTNNLLLFKSSL